MSEEVVMTINIESEEKKEKEGHNEEKDLNGDFENNKAEQDKKEMNDYKNNQLMEIDDEINNKVNKTTENNDEAEKDNGAINKPKEIDNVSNIENHEGNEIPLIILDNEKKEEKDLNGDFENNTAENDKKEMDDYKNKTLMQKDDENNDKVNKNAQNNNKEKDNETIDKLKEIDNVSNIENHEENEIPLITLDDEEKEGCNEEKDLNGDIENNTAEKDKKEIDDYKNKQLMEIDDGNNDKVNKNARHNNKKEKDNGTINKLKEIDNVSNIENHEKNEIPLITLDDEEKEEKEGYNEEKDLNGDFENNTAENDKKEIDDYKNKHLMEIDDENNDKVNKNILHNIKEEKDNGAINKLEEIDNVSKIENPDKNEIPLIILDDEEDNNTITLIVVKKEYDDRHEGTNFTDDNLEELELGNNMIKDDLLLKDDEQKCENDADKNSDEREIKLIECNHNLEEEISKKRKNDGEKGSRKRTKSH